MDIEPVQASLFNYAELDTETRIVVQQRTEEIKVLVRRSAQDIIDIGSKLIDVKARLGHGNFGGWLESEFGWSDQTARRFMHVAEFSKINTGVDFMNIQAKALYLLAAPSTPEAARIEAIERAQNGETITHRTAQNIVSEYRAVTPLNATRVTLQPTPANGARSFVAPYVPSEYEEMGEAPPMSPDNRKNGNGHTALVAPIAPNHMAIHYSSETPEHYTPMEIIEAAIAVLGTIDLDPCSNSKDTPNVPALEHFTEADNGLSLPWFGSVYMNPPYGRVIGDWTRKLTDEYQRGNVTEAITLVPGRIDTQWWQSLGFQYPACFYTGRLTFIGNDDPAPFPSTIFYLGEDIAKFYEVFSAIGQIWTRIDEHWFTS